jgi:hypothetical protein
MLEDEELPLPVTKHSTLTGLLPVALVIGVAGFIVCIITFAVMSTVGMDAYSTFHFSRAEANASNIIVSYAVAAGAGCFFIRMLMGTAQGSLFRSIEWRQSPVQIALVTLLGICVTFIVRFSMTGHWAGVTIRGTQPSLLFVLVLLGTVVVQPLVEEIYFRGILFAGLSSKLGPLVSICLVTLVFVLVHVQHRWIVLPISIILGMVRLFTKSTANCFFLHAAYNLGVVLWGVR